MNDGKSSIPCSKPYGVCTRPLRTLSVVVITGSRLTRICTSSHKRWCTELESMSTRPQIQCGDVESTRMRKSTCMSAAVSLR